MNSLLDRTGENAEAIFLFENPYFEGIRTKTDDFNVPRTEITSRDIAKTSFTGIKKHALLKPKRREADRDHKVNRSTLEERFAVTARSSSMPVREAASTVSETNLVDDEGMLASREANLAAEATAALKSLLAPLEPLARLFHGSQALLPLRGEFSPSIELTSYWVRGVEAHNPLNVNGVPATKWNVTPEIRADFARLLKSTIGTLGQQRRYSRVRDPLISKCGRFSTLLQNEFCENFVIVPDESGDFLELLHREIRVAIEEGARFSGDWGEVVADAEDSLYFNLTDAFFFEEEGFQKMVIVE